MSVLDLRGAAAGDPTGLAVLAADLRSAATALVGVAPAHEGAARALLRAAGALDEAASALRDLPRPAPAGSVEGVEARLARRLREPAEALTREIVEPETGSTSETERTQVV